MISTKEASMKEGILFNSGNYDGVSSAQAKDQIGELLNDKKCSKESHQLSFKGLAHF
jgi:Leucyl-tRNA synthetase